MHLSPVWVSDKFNYAFTDIYQLSKSLHNAFSNLSQSSADSNDDNIPKQYTYDTQAH